MVYIRSSKHTLKYTNWDKSVIYKSFLQEYRRVSCVLVKYLFENYYTYTKTTRKGDTVSFTIDVKNNIYSLPKYLDYNDLILKTNLKTDLSARALSSLVRQLAGEIRGRFKGDKKYRHIMPDLSNINPELSSKCTDIEFTNGEFNGFIRLSRIGKNYGHIKIPFKLHKHSNKFKNGKLKGSFLLCDNHIEFRWSMKSNPNQGKQTVGADQGLRTLLTLSDGQTTPMIKDGKTFQDIIDKIHRTKKGSKGRERAIQERDNYIKWSLNQIDLSKIKEIRIEDIKGLKKNTKNGNHFWSYTVIHKKLASLAETDEVRLVKVKSYYKSQCCPACDYIHPSNRKDKLFECIDCGYKNDADLVGAINNSFRLDFDNWDKVDLINGFYWDK